MLDHRDRRPIPHFRVMIFGMIHQDIHGPVGALFAEFLGELDPLRLAAGIPSSPFRVHTTLHGSRRC